jgi:voltage-gated potassium channel
LNAHLAGHEGSIASTHTKSIERFETLSWRIAATRSSSALRKTKLLALDAKDFHALIERVPTLAAHVQKTAEARLADTAEAQRGDLAAAEIAQATQDDTPAGE